MSYSDDGVYIIAGAVPHDLCDKAAAFIDSYYAKQFGRVVNMHMNSPAIMDVITQDVVYEWVKNNCFDNPSIYTTLAFQYGTQQAIHRDTPHFHTVPEGRFIGVWYALEDADESNGCLMYIRGGHKLNDVRNIVDPHRAAIDFAIMEYQADILARCLDAGLDVELLPIKKGDAVVWDAYLPHGGAPILCAGKKRRSVVAHCVPIGTPVFNAKYFFGDIELPLQHQEYIKHSKWDVRVQPPAAFQSDYI